jgi:hypothetical protein
LSLLEPACGIGAIGLMALEAAGALGGQPVGAFGSTDHYPSPPWLVASPALAVQLNHHIRAQDGVLLAGKPLVQLRPEALSRLLG